MKRRMFSNELNNRSGRLSSPILFFSCQRKISSVKQPHLKFKSGNFSKTLFRKCFPNSVKYPHKHLQSLPKILDWSFFIMKKILYTIHILIFLQSYSGQTLFLETIDYSWNLNLFILFKHSRSSFQSNSHIPLHFTTLLDIKGPFSHQFFIPLLFDDHFRFSFDFLLCSLSMFPNQTKTEPDWLWSHFFHRLAFWTKP